MLRMINTSVRRQVTAAARRVDVARITPKPVWRTTCGTL